MRRHLVLPTLLIFLTALWSGLPVVAQSGGWTPPVDVSDATPSSIYGPVGWFPDLAVGPDGSVHIVWNGGIVTDKAPIDALLYRELRDGKWSPVNNIAVTGSGGYTVRNSIIMGRDGRLHVLLRVGTNIAQFSAAWDSAWPAGSWSTPHNIGDGYYNALAMDSKGTLHALKTQGVVDDVEKPRLECPNCANLFYRRSSDGGDTWSSPVNLSAAFEGANRPQIKVDQFDRIHVVWDEGFDWYAGKGYPKTGVYRWSGDGGTTWSAPTVFSLPDDVIEQTALALTAEGNPMVVYRSVRGKGSELYFQRSTDGGARWSDPAKIPGVLARSSNDPNLDIYSMATDSIGKIHLLMVGFKSGEASGQQYPALLHLTWDGTAWSAPEVVMQTDLYPEWPRMVVYGGNQLHAVWFTRNILYAGSWLYRVWYSSKVLDAPAATSLPLFTPTPTLVPTTTPQPTPSPTPLPRLVRNATLENAPSGQPKLDSEAVSLLLFTSGPILILVAMIWAVRRARSRP